MKKDQKNNPVVIGVLVLVLVGSLIKTVMTLTGGSSLPPPPITAGATRTPSDPNNPLGGMDGEGGAKDMTGLKTVSQVETGMHDPFSHPLLTRQAEKESGSMSGAGQPSSSIGGILPDAAPRVKGKTPAPLGVYPISPGGFQNLMTPGSHTINRGSHAPKPGNASGVLPLLPGLPTGQQFTREATKPTAGKRRAKAKLPEATPKRLPSGNSKPF